MCQDALICKISSRCNESREIPSRCCTARIISRRSDVICEILSIHKTSPRGLFRYGGTTDEILIGKILC
ncbi:hypothetical protein, partial [uncultured Campylobacter sp.]|uniref:hypothetical protein n=1 Tax=uncultured Campylobacter sp. TaxID=218934 RepID=UPI00262BCA9A